MGYARNPDFVRNPNYHFSNGDNKGIDNVPNGRMITVENFNGKSKCFLKLNSDNLDKDTTLKDALTKGAIEDINQETIDELEKAKTNLKDYALKMAIALG